MATIRKRRDTYEVQAAVPDFRTLPDEGETNRSCTMLACRDRAIASRPSR